MTRETRISKVEDAERRRLRSAIDSLIESLSTDELSAFIYWLEQKSSIADLREVLANYRSWLADYRAARPMETAS